MPTHCTAFFTPRLLKDTLTCMPDRPRHTAGHSLACLTDLVTLQATHLHDWQTSSHCRPLTCMTDRPRQIAGHSLACMTDHVRLQATHLHAWQRSDGRSLTCMDDRPRQTAGHSLACLTDHVRLQAAGKYLVDNAGARVPTVAVAGGRALRTEQTEYGKTFCYESHGEM